MTLLAQVTIFGTMLLTGMLLGIWLDLFRFINRRGQTSYIPVLDLLFWAVITCIVFIVLININFLELRMYVFLSLVLGLFIYLKTLSRQILQLYTWGFDFILKVIKWIWRILRPLTIPLRIASGLLDNGIEILLSIIALLMLVVFKRSRQDNTPTA